MIRWTTWGYSSIKTPPLESRKVTLELIPICRPARLRGSMRLPVPCFVALLASDSSRTDGELLTSITLHRRF